MPVWHVEGEKPKFRAVEYDDAGNKLRTLGPVWSRLKAIGLIAKCTREDAARAEGKTITRLICEMSSRPSGRTCGSPFKVMLTEYDQLGSRVKKAVCEMCRGKMLNGPQMAWA